MTGPAVVLVLAGMLLSFTPHLKLVATQSSVIFQNPEGYAVPADNSHLLGIVALACAAIGAVCYLFSKPFRSTSHWILRPLGVLHTLHSGHVGDYVAFLTFGIAVFGLVCIFCLK
jgi:multicomponent Na+:H+ antiporter subunit D